LTQIAGQPVVDCLTIDGYKFRLADNSWLMIALAVPEPSSIVQEAAPTAGASLTCLAKQ